MSMKMRGGWRRLLALGLAASLVCGACGGKESASAASMFLTKFLGTVAVSDGEGKDVPIAEGLGLYGGYQLSTREASYAWIDLDQVKLAKMSENCRAGIEKKDKKLEITVDAGSLFFHVTEPLGEDEAMNIRTSDMIVGIRGTCGWIDGENPKHAQIYILEGTVECMTADNASEEVVEGTFVSAGEVGRLVYDEDGGVRVTVEPFDASQIPDFVLEEIEKDQTLREAAAGLPEPFEEETTDEGEIPRFGGAVTFAAGDANRALIDEDGKLWIWGWGMWGNNTYDENAPEVSQTPTQVLENVVSVSLTAARGSGADVPNMATAAVQDDGSLWIWGDMSLGGGGPMFDQNMRSGVPVKVMDDVAAVSLGTDFAAVVKTDGSLWTWGYNTLGQLGNGGQADYGTEWGWKEQTVPTKILDDVAMVSAGESAAAAVKTDKSLWMWGDNSYGQLGIGSTQSSAVPVKVMDDVAAVSVGGKSTAAIKTDGSLWMWGDNAHGQLGNGRQGNQSVTEEYDEVDWDPYTEQNSPRYAEHPIQTVPTKILDDVLEVSTGMVGTAAVKTDGSLWIWGLSSLVPEGDATVQYVGVSDRAYLFESRVQTVPKMIDEGVSAVKMRYSNPIFARTDGSVWYTDYDGNLTQLMEGTSVLLPESAGDQ